jgi:hypothetical protein
MKNIATLGFGFLFSLTSFAFAPNRLVVSAEGNAAITVTVDGIHSNRQWQDNSIVFENLIPGFHAVKIYQLNKYVGYFRGREDDYRLIYTASVNIRPMFETTIELNRFGKAFIDEQPVRDKFDHKSVGNLGRKIFGRDFENRGHNDCGYGDDDYSTDNVDYDNHNTGYGHEETHIYNHVVSDDDFMAFKRMLDRESFDNTRLVIAKHIVDVNEFTAIQVKELAGLFSFDYSRLDFAKYAYYKTIDKNNYAIVCNAFSFSSGKEQLFEFIRNWR